jgi:hypothetical protein
MLAALWLGALVLASMLTLGQRPAELAAQPDLPLIVIDESLTIHPSARIATPDEAAARGLDMVQGWTGAETPRVVKIELLPAHRAGGYHGNTPAWRVTFDSAEFGVRCPHTPPGTAHACPPGSRARVAFLAGNGLEIALEVGWPDSVWE